MKKQGSVNSTLLISEKETTTQENAKGSGPSFEKCTLVSYKHIDSESKLSLDQGRERFLTVLVNMSLLRDRAHSCLNGRLCLHGLNMI